MRTILLSVVAVIGLAALTLPFGAGDGALGQDKKPAEKAPAQASPSAIAKLIKDLTSRDQKVQKIAVSALEKMGVDAIGELFEAFENADGETRQEVAMVLGGIRRQAIAENEDDVAALIEDVLLKALRDPNYRVVSGAAGALTHIEPRSKKAIPVYIAILRSDDTTHVARSAARVGLSNFGPEAAAAIPLLLADLAKKRVEKMPNVKVEHMADAVSSSKDYIPGERAHICGVLAVIGPKDERVVAALSQALKNRNEDPTIRAGAAGSLAWMGPPGQAALPDIIAFFKETDKDKNKFLGERQIIMQALGRLKLTKKDIPLVIDVATGRALSSERQMAVTVLANNASVAGAAWMPFLKMLYERDEFEVYPGYTYYQVVDALGKIDPPADEPKEVLANQLKTIFERDRIDQEIPELGIAAKKLLKKLKGK